RRHTTFSRDWSSDVCSSDLLRALQRRLPSGAPLLLEPSGRPAADGDTGDDDPRLQDALPLQLPSLPVALLREAHVRLSGGGAGEIGRASCRERVEMACVAGA